jgi:sodium-dependent phosphate transporter
MLEPYSSSVLWIVTVSFIVGFVLAFGIGANTVPNSFATSVGAKVLTVRQACCLGTVFEMAGALLLGKYSAVHSYCN